MPRLRLLATLLLSGLLFATSLQAAQYRILSQPNEQNVAYRANDFYSIYQLYFNLVLALELDKRLAAADIEQLLFASIDNLTKNRFSQLQVGGYPGPEPLRVTLRTDLLPGEEQPILWLISNYDPQLQSVVSDDALQNAYGTYFYMPGDKLVKYQLAAQPLSEAELAKLPVLNRADYYLLDGEAGNDRRGRQLLIDALASATSQAERLTLNLSLASYYLLDGNSRGAQARIDAAREILREMPAEQRRGLRVPFHYARTITDLYLKYQAR